LFIVQKAMRTTILVVEYKRTNLELEARVWNHQMELTTTRDQRKSRTFANFDGHHSIQLYKGGIQECHCPTTSMAPLMTCFTLLYILCVEWTCIQKMGES